MKKLMLVFTLFAISSMPGFAQTFGEITGAVRDTTGAVVVSASVTIVNVATNATRSTVTNDSGVYSFPSLPPGMYNVRAEKQGFKRSNATNIEVQVQAVVRLDLDMTVGSVSESIEVSASLAMLSTENSTVGTVVENKRIVELPLNGRNYLQLVSLSPNTSTGFPSAGQARSRQGGFRSEQSIAVAGQRSSFNHYSLDGVENTDPNFNTFVIQPSIDALQEFKVQTGIYPAEFGRATSQINVLTKSGSNQFHGTAFEFLRNEKLDAKNYAFRTARPPKDPFKWNQYGGTFGGPVIIPKLFNGKDRLFFMGNYEAFRQRRSTQSLYTIPTSAMQDGNFNGVTTVYDPRTRTGTGPDITSTPFAGNIIPASRIEATSKKLLDFYPRPNLPGVSQNYQQAQGAPINRDQFILRLDFVESPKSQWAGRYSWGDEVQFNSGLRLNGAQILTNVEQYMGSNTRTLSSSVVTETRFGYTRFYNSTARELAGVRDVVKDLAIPGMNSGAPITWGIPAIGLSGWSGFGDDSEGPYENSNNSMQFLNNTSWVRGKHTFRFGGEIRRDQYNQDGNQFARGSFGFENNATRRGPTGADLGGNSFGDFLLGEIRRAETAVAIGSARFRATSFVFYVDDSWKITNKLTFALGLRYENTPPWLDTTGKLFSAALPNMDSTPNVADRSRYPVFVRQGKGTNPYDGIVVRWPNIDVVQDGRLGDRLVRRDNNDFAPRIGITWNPSQKVVIRTGVGLFYAQDTGNPRFDMARNIAGRFRQESVSDRPDRQWNNAFREIAGALAQVPNPYSFSNLFDRRTPYVMQYLLNVQREFTRNLVLEVGYLGSGSRKLESLRAVNESIPGASGSVISRAPYPNFGRIQLVDNGARGNYNSLGMKLTKRYSGGLSALVSYTYAKSIDETSGIRSNDGDTLFPQNSYCMRCERALSTFDTRHRFVTSVLYDVPFGKGRMHSIGNPVLNAVAGGWQLGSIVTISTGFPLTVTSGSDQSNTGAGFDRPLYVSGVNPNVSNHDPVKWFDVAAYRVQPFGTFGNVGRNTLISPSIFSWDFSTLKNFKLPGGEAHMLQFRFEAFNFANHPSWGNPGTNAGSPSTFGVITGTRTNMRNLQLALKYIF
ncbi:MAG: carboxypeptidase regulatory-like domain-containing protein [Candidatus Solibacter usitatus]|nr:carboxypeptidase regulatory-like domain-containing protein [Candidatus Solibacter usitatus]